MISIFPALIASIIDISITIIHQAPEYWQGDLSKANEGNPIGAILMAKSVYGLFIISGIWLVLIVLFGYYLPKKISRIFILFVVIAHSYAVNTWISPRYGFWWAMFIILINTLVYIFLEDLVKSESKIQKKQTHKKASHVS